MNQPPSFVKTQQARSTATAAPIDFSGMTALVIDDKFQVGESSCGILRNLGFRKMILASRPKQAELQLITRNFHLLFADNDCPMKNGGLEFMEKYGDEFQAMVLYTAEPDVDKIRRANTLGAELLGKPSSESQIREAIEKAFNRKAMKAEILTPGGR